MKLKINTDSIQFLCVKAGVPRLNYDSQTPKMEQDTGLPLFSTQLVDMDETGGEVLTVITAGNPKVNSGHQVSVHNLVATPWSQGKRSGISYRAESITIVRGETNN